MIGSSKNNRENYPRKCFDHKKKKPGLNLTPGFALIGLRTTGPWCKVAFLLIRPIVVFSPFSLPSLLSITRFYILFEQILNIIESFAVALAKSLHVKGHSLKETNILGNMLIVRSPRQNNIYINIYLCDFDKRCPLGFRLNTGIARVQASVAGKKRGGLLSC